METEYVDLIFCGNPGVGKSTLLTSVSEIQFKSGFNWGEGLTNRLDLKESPALPGIRFGDTPGLADIAMAERAAEAITTALKDGANQGRRTLIFFIVTVEAGRVKPDDLFTIKQVMGSITFPDGTRPSKNDYGVIINKCTFLNRPDFETKGRMRFVSTFGVRTSAVPFTTGHLYFIPHVEELVDREDRRHTFHGLNEWIASFPGIFIGNANKIDVSGLEEKLTAAKKAHRAEMEALENKLKNDNQLVLQTLQDEIERTKRDLEEKLRRAQEKRPHGKQCSIM